MTEWLSNEEKSLENQRKRQMSGTKKIWVIMALVLSIAAVQAADCIRCPRCEEIFEIEIEAKRIPGAGYVCDSCGFFYVHGNRCPHCKYPKTE